MVEGWEEFQLSEISNNFDPKRIPVKKHDRKPGPFPYYGASGIVDHVHDYIYDGTYVLVSEDGDNLKARNTPIAFLAHGRFWVNNHAHILQGNDLALTEFLAYSIEQTDITPYLSGSTRPKLTKGYLNKIKVNTPPIKEQKRIAEILGALDDKIEVNLKMNKTLEEMAQALYKEWFVDFGPVIDKARQAGNPIPDELETKAAKRRHLKQDEIPYGLDQSTYALFPDSFEDSELGPIPKGWEVKNYFEVANLLSGGTPKTKITEYWNGDIKWVSGKDIGGNSACFTLDTEKKVTPLGIQKSAAKILPRHTAIIVARGSVGNLTIIAEEMAMNQSCYGIKAKQDSDQFWLYLGIVKRIADLKQVAYGSVFDTITTDTFKGLNFPVASNPLTTQFEQLINASFTQIETNQRENQTLTQTRDTLLPKLISGEIRVILSTQTKRSFMTLEMQRKLAEQNSLIQEAQKLETHLMAHSGVNPKSLAIVKDLNSCYDKISAVFQSPKMIELTQKIRMSQNQEERERLWNDLLEEKERFYRDENLNP